MKKILSVLTAGIVLAGSLLVASCKLEESDTIANLVADQTAPLGVVANLKAEESYGTVVLTWDAVPDARAYRVVRYDKDLNATVLPNGNVSAVTVNKYNDGKTTKVWFLDKQVEVAGKYTYGVQALVSTDPNTTVAARNLYISNGPESLVEVEVALKAVTSDLVKDVKFETGKTNTYKLTVPAVELGVEYKYLLADYTTAAKAANDVECDDFAWQNAIITYNHPGWKVSELEISGNREVQLLLAVKAIREKDTSKYVVVNTAKTAVPNVVINEALDITQSRVSLATAVAKYELFVRDYGFDYGTVQTAPSNGTTNAVYAKKQTPDNFTYTYKAYKVEFDANEFTWKIPETPVITETALTLDVYDANQSNVWGAKILTPELKAGDYYVYVVTKTDKVTGKQVRASEWVAGADAVLTGTALSSYVYDHKADFDFYYSTGLPTSTAPTAVTGGGTTSTTTTTYTFNYHVGTDYSIVGLYRAQKGSSDSVNLDSYIKTEFVATGLTSASTTTSAYEKNCVRGYYTKNESYTTTTNASGVVITPTTSNDYVYALVVKETATGKYAVKYLTVNNVIENR